MGYSPRGCKVLDTTEQLNTQHMSFTHTRSRGHVNKSKEDRTREDTVAFYNTLKQNFSSSALLTFGA